MMLEEADESTVVPLLPAGGRRSHDDPSQSVLEQQPSPCGARQCPRREVLDRPGTGEALLSKCPDEAAPVPNLTRKRTSVDGSVRVKRRDDELVA